MLNYFFDCARVSEQAIKIEHGVHRHRLPGLVVEHHNIEICEATTHESTLVEFHDNRLRELSQLSCNLNQRRWLRSEEALTTSNSEAKGIPQPPASSDVLLWLEQN